MRMRDSTALKNRSGWARLPFVRAGVSLAAIVASFAIVAVLCRLCGTQPQPAILAAFVALSLSRRPSPAGREHLLAVTATLAAVALGAAGVGFLLRAIQPVGAIVFIAGMFCSIWLRNFGGLARKAGALIAMPLVAMLIVPPPAIAADKLVPDVALLTCAGVVALGCVTTAQWLAGRSGVALFPPEHLRQRPQVLAAQTGLTPQTRMALQLAVGLAAAFAVGFAFFPAHWGWTVLTTVIVCSATRSRGDALCRSILRLAGAVAGTAGAAAIAHVAVSGGAFEATTIFIVLYLGLLLRDVNYAYWACCMTLILALLTPLNGGGALLGLRLEAILAGALCAVAATWLVLPIRTEAVIRRRLADALRALDDVVAQAPESDRAVPLAIFEHRIAELDVVAPPALWHHRIFVFARTPEHPANWIDLAGEIGCHARNLCTRRDFDRGAVRRAIGVCRRAIATHGGNNPTAGALAVSASLRMLSDAMATTGQAHPALRSQTRRWLRRPCRSLPNPR